MFPFKKKKKENVSTQPLVPESPFTRDVDVERGAAGPSRERSVTLPPARKDFMDFPPQWRERQCIMTTWTYFSMITLILMFCCPYGAILGVVGGSMYTCRCCMPKKENAKGMKAAFCIHFFAFLALFVDIISVVVTVAIGAFYLIADCPYSDTLCDYRSLVGLFVFGGAALMLFRFILALTVFLSMRDYRREIQREELLEKRLKDELDERFREYQKRMAAKKKSKKKREAAPDMPSTSA